MPGTYSQKHSDADQQSRPAHRCVADKHSLPSTRDGCIAELKTRSCPAFALAAEGTSCLYGRDLLMQRRLPGVCSGR
jgi:hypothetical protein